jgi:hypothetical protein
MIMVLISIMPSTRRQHTTKKTLRGVFFSNFKSPFNRMLNDFDVEVALRLNRAGAGLRLWSNYDFSVALGADGLERGGTCRTFEGRFSLSASNFIQFTLNGPPSTQCSYTRAADVLTVSESGPAQLTATVRGASLTLTLAPLRTGAASVQRQYTIGT